LAAPIFEFFKPTFSRQVARAGFYRDIVAYKIVLCNKLRWKIFKTATLLQKY